MEINGGVLGARLAASVKKAVDVVFEEEVYLTDSTAMLGLIRAESGSLSTYGGNRIGEIQDLTSKDDWKWIKTDLNIADLEQMLNQLILTVHPSTKEALIGYTGPRVSGQPQLFKEKYPEKSSAKQQKELC